MKTIKFIIAVAFLIISLSLIAEDGFGGQAGAFLRIPLGVRASGLGNSYVAIADDANGAFWNPGGLYQLHDITFGAMYNLLSMDRHHYSGSIVIPISQQRLSVMWNNFGVSDIDGRDNEGNPTETFNDNEMSFALSLCHELNPTTGIGASVKYLLHSISDNKATGFGIDIGVHKKLGSLMIGASIANIGSKLKWDTDSSEEEEIPTTIRAGAAYKFDVNSINILPVVEITKNAGEEVYFHFGAETKFFNTLSLRSGFDQETINFGASIEFLKYKVEYAYCPDVLDEGTTNKLGIQIKY